MLTIIDTEVPQRHVKLSTVPSLFSKRLINFIFSKKEAPKNYKICLANNDIENAKNFKNQISELRKLNKLETSD